MFTTTAQTPPKPGPKPGVSGPTEPQLAQAQTAEEPRPFMNRQPLVFDGKRMRKAVIRKTIDYNSCVVRYLENRKWFKNLSSKHAIQPDEAYAAEVLPPVCMTDNPMNAVTTKFVRTSTNKLRCPIFCVVWTPEGRRLVTGASSGEFTLWNGLTFNFETILTAHDSPVRSMVWNHSDSWLLSADHGGMVKYWQSNMNNVQMYEAHKEPIRGLSFSPTDNKYASCADDGLVKIWDFYRCTEEKVLRGHGADVKCIDWHPTRSLLVSGSKDSQQPIKLWDTRTGNGLATLHLHKSTVMSIKWNQNGNWLLTASRDHLLKLFDIRVMKEIQSFRGHKREATAIAWHPIHENLFASGGSDGSVMFWMAGVEKDVGNMDSAHDGMVWSLAWHPLGHILCSGSNDHSSKFWTRNRLGDRMRDRYNLNIQDTEDDMGEDFAGAVRGFSVHHTTAIPGMDTTYSASDADLLESDVYDNGFGGHPKHSEPKPTQITSVVDKSKIPGFVSSAASKSASQVPGIGSGGPRTQPFSFRRNDGPALGHIDKRTDAPPFLPRPQMDMPGAVKREDKGKPWEHNNKQGPDNRIQARGGPSFPKDPPQELHRPFSQGGGPDNFGPNRPQNEFRPQERDPRQGQHGQGPDFRGPPSDPRRGPGFDNQRPPNEQRRGTGPDGWGPSGDPSSNPSRGPGFDNQGPPNEQRRGSGPDGWGPPGDPRRDQEAGRRPSSDPRRGPGFDNQGPPNEQRRGSGPDRWGHPGDQRREHEADRRGPGPDNRGPPNDPRRPPNEIRHGPDFRQGPQGDGRSQDGPPSSRDMLRRGLPNNLPSQVLEGKPGLLGSPPHGQDIGLGLLGAPPNEGPHGHEPGRPSGERENRVGPLSPRYDVSNGPHPHPNDLGSRGLRHGDRGHEIDQKLHRELDSNDNSHPYLGNPSSRGFKHDARGRGAPRDAHKQRDQHSLGPEDPRRPWPSTSGPGEPHFGRPPEDRGQPDMHPFDRAPWDNQPEHDRGHSRDMHEFRPPGEMDRDPRGPPAMERGHGPRDPRGPPPRGPPPRDPRESSGGPHYNPRDPRGSHGPHEHRLSNEPQRPPEGGAPAIKPLMSLGTIAPPPGVNIDIDDLALGDAKVGPAQRKRLGDGEHDRDREHDRDHEHERNRERDPRDLDWERNRDNFREGGGDRGPPPQKVMRLPPGPPEDRRDSRGEKSFAEDQWDDVSWNKNEDQFQSGGVGRGEMEWRGRR